MASDVLRIFKEPHVSRVVLRRKFVLEVEFVVLQNPYLIAAACVSGGPLSSSQGLVIKQRACTGAATNH